MDRQQTRIHYLEMAMELVKILHVLQVVYLDVEVDKRVSGKIEMALPQ